MKYNTIQCVAVVTMFKRCPKRPWHKMNVAGRFPTESVKCNDMFYAET